MHYLFAKILSLIFEPPRLLAPTLYLSYQFQLFRLFTFLRCRPAAACFLR